MASKKTNAVSKAAVKSVAAEKKTNEKKEVKTSVYVEYGNGQIDIKNIVQDVLAASSADGVTAESVEVYIKPEENAAYYVVNGKSEGKKIDLYF